MRLLYVVSLFPCWSETFIVNEIRHLIALGVDIRIVSLKPASETLVQPDAAALLSRVSYPKRSPLPALTEIFRRPGSSLHELTRIVGGLLFSPVACAKTLVVWWRTLGLLPALRAMQLQHIHAHWATYPSTAAMLAAGRLALPFSFTAHAHDIFVNDHFLREKLLAARFAVTISDFNRTYLRDCFGDDATSKLEVVHCGVAVDGSQSNATERDPRLILAVGRLDTIKGFRHLIDACAALLKTGIDFHCLIIGEGHLRQALQSQINRLGLSERVSLIGARRQQEVQDALRRSAVFVLPSVVTATGDRDGIPVALMEAMAAGTPVVSSAVSGIPELVVDGETGLLVRPTDADELAACVRRVLLDRPFAALLAVNARRKVVEQFSVTHQAAHLYRHFNASIAQSA